MRLVTSLEVASDPSHTLLPVNVIPCVDIRVKLLGDTPSECLCHTPVMQDLDIAMLARLVGEAKVRVRIFVSFVGFGIVD